MSKQKIIVTGANGQLGRELRELAHTYTDYDFRFLPKEELPIYDSEAVEATIESIQPHFLINCAAYTAVDKAESDKEQAFLVNAVATGVLAAACYAHGTKFIHISTDYVFDGSSPQAYKEDAKTNPVNTYGASKLEGEMLCMQNNPDAIIVRTAWVYSAFGNNFVKTMLRLMKERSTLNVVSDQVGAPTYAADLANAIMQIISAGKWSPGIYHYSNSGRISWYDFAVAIRDASKLSCAVQPIGTEQYPTPAKRPAYSLLDTNKIRETFGLAIPEWKASLELCLAKLG
jgi:dTDP-4-dehydrorhamnose reductase